jgi:ferric-dicitrate binding protein FerR (iron transport regulator)
MSEHDEELQKLLQRWEAPLPRRELDERVLRSFRLHRARRRWKWMPVAAGILLAAGLAQHWIPHRKHSVSIETTTSAAGYEPIPDGAITVIEEGKK